MAGGGIAFAPPPSWRAATLRPMKSPLKSISESGCCRFGLLRFLAVCAAAAFFANGAAAEPLDQPHVHADSPGGTAVSPEIAAQKKVNDLEIQLHNLQVQMANLQSTEPQDPGPNATEAQRKKYKQDHARWQSQVDKVQHQIDAVTTQLALARKDLQALQHH